MTKNCRWWRGGHSWGVWENFSSRRMVQYRTCEACGRVKTALT